MMLILEPKHTLKCGRCRYFSQISKQFPKLMVINQVQSYTISLPQEGGGYSVYLSDGDVPFSGYGFYVFFKHVKRGNLVRSGCYLIQFLCF